MGGQGNHRSFGGLKFRRLLKAFILGNGNKIPLRRSCSTKDADEGPDEPDIQEFFEPLVEKSEEIPCQTKVVTPQTSTETETEDEANEDFDFDLEETETTPDVEFQLTEKKHEANVSLAEMHMLAKEGFIYYAGWLGRGRKGM